MYITELTCEHTPTHTHLVDVNNIIIKYRECEQLFPLNSNNEAKLYIVCLLNFFINIVIYIGAQKSVEIIVDTNSNKVSVMKNNKRDDRI